jgi:Xaa-Pro dipeptidase
LATSDKVSWLLSIRNLRRRKATKGTNITRKANSRLMQRALVAQRYMQIHGIDGWLVCDFRGSNDVMWQLLGARASTTRRAFLFLPRTGRPEALVHAVDRPQLDPLLCDDVTYYLSWRDMEDWLKGRCASRKTLALEYSPECAIPTMSIVDAGLVERIRSFGSELVSSADLYQSVLATWDDESLQSHLEAVEEVVASLTGALHLVRSRVEASVAVTEYDVQAYLMDQFDKRHLETDDPPIVAVNENSGNPHYEPNEHQHSRIERGDWLLIDLWARQPGPGNVFADITWVAYVGRDVPRRFQEIFAIVAGARDSVVQALKEAWAHGVVLAGWQLDDVARSYIEQRGFGQYFVHRTGHSIGPGENLHALGVNLDNLETHDSRQVLPKVGFSVEPGIYLPDFGVRTEIDVFMDPADGPRVTTPIQTTIDELL